MTPKQIETRKRLRDDFTFYCANCVKIRTKDGKISPLILNRVQTRFVERIIEQQQKTGKVRFVVLKARQQGLSTVVSAWSYWWTSQRKAQKALVMAHVAESTTTLFEMYHRIHSNAPKIVQPSTKYSSRTELVFEALDSGLRVATAGGKGVARGEMLNVVHLSEVAFWPTTFAQQNFNGLIQAVPDAKGTAVFLESTANGMTGVFYDQYRAAKQGTSGYELFFSAWVESDEYRDDSVPKDFIRLTDEDEIVATAKAIYGIDVDNAQLWWRRRKIATNGSDLFKQEYPLTPEEAFISTGRPVFNPDYIATRLKTPKAPIKQMAVEEVYDKQTGKRLPLRKLRDHPRGELKVYYERDPNETYTIGADVSMGLRGNVRTNSQGVIEPASDPSVAQVLDSKLRQVAVWRGWVHPDIFAEILVALGYHYNEALIVPERNNHGLVTCVELRDQQYPNLYLDVTEGSIEPDRETLNIGVFTSEKTKPLMIDKLRAFDRSREIEINDALTLEEMLTFVVTESGKMEADGDAHDDCVMSLALAAYASDGRWEPVTVTDEYYTHAL
jgi:hypothetical protein